jgi:hypothetical protein
LYQINYWINLFLLTEPSNSLLFITVSLLVSRIKLGHIKSFFQTNVLLAWSVLRMLTFVSCLTKLVFPLFVHYLITKWATSLLPIPKAV